jgi:hypothetical protein
MHTGRGVDAVRLLVSHRAFDSLVALLRRMSAGYVVVVVVGEFTSMILCNNRNELAHHRAFGVCVDELLEVGDCHRCVCCALTVSI